MSYNKDDYIIIEKSKLKRYRSTCDSCGADRGYLRKVDSDKVCRTCSSLKRHTKSNPDMPGVCWQDIIIKQDGINKRKYYRCFCIKCGISRGYHRRRSILRCKLGMCRSCASSEIHLNKTVSIETRKKMSSSSWVKKNPDQHPMLGKKRSEKIRKILSVKQKSYCKKHGNQFVTGSSKGQHSQDTIIRLSKANTGKEPQWKGRTFIYNGPNGNMKLRSSYELAYATWLDKEGIQWQYEPKFKLSDGRIFSPDFKLGTGVIIEIKGYWTNKAIDKWTMFCTDYPDIIKQVLMKSDLQELGIL